MTEVIEDFPELEDPANGNPLMGPHLAHREHLEHARRGACESCIYTGITIAEYYRDMGYDVALMADSTTSRWAEAREILPAGGDARRGGVPGVPRRRPSRAVLRARRLLREHQRDGRVRLGDRRGVSPPGDFSEPVTQNTLRIVKTFWALDADLAERRHFPSINWNESYSLYKDPARPVVRERSRRRLGGEAPVGGRRARRGD